MSIEENYQEIQFMGLELEKKISIPSNRNGNERIFSIKIRYKII